LLTIVSRSVEETISLGEKFGELVSAGDFIALTGELGSGKTHFTQGVAAGLGVDPSIRVTSPTYTIMNSYAGRLHLHHFDLYRLSGDQDAAELGFEEYFNGTGVCIVEWAERLQDLLPDGRMTVIFSYIDDTVRAIAVEPHGARYEELARDLSRSLRYGQMGSVPPGDGFFQSG
jgi:tRNA threonylcarbamoyladenosine biosynthesis protein TsaE